VITDKKVSKFIYLFKTDLLAVINHSKWE